MLSRARHLFFAHTSWRRASKGSISQGTRKLLGQSTTLLGRVVARILEDGDRRLVNVR